MVQLEEVRDEPIGSNSTSDANVAEQVEAPMARDAPPQPRRSARVRQAREISLPVLSWFGLYNLILIPVVAAYAIFND